MALQSIINNFPTWACLEKAHLTNNQEVQNERTNKSILNNPGAISNNANFPSIWNFNLPIFELTIEVQNESQITFQKNGYSKP